MKLNNLYETFKNKFFKNRFFNLNQFYRYTYLNIKKKKIIGYSLYNNPIFLFKKGNGLKKILIWSQMHGNETTGTLAMLDLWNILESDLSKSLFKSFLEKYEIHYIPILNPDGSKIWTRENAIGIDINRDFHAEQSYEIKILKNQFKKIKYQLAFNLHDQRSFFSVGKKNFPATLSFLSPSINYQKTLSKTRMCSMGIIASIYKKLYNEIPNQIGRYSDDFYPNSTGDNFQKLEVPTILFEAGHFINDYNRSFTRKYFCFALIYALIYISQESNWNKNYYEYFKIPENSLSFSDIIIFSARFNLNGKKIITDLSIHYQEKIEYTNSSLIFYPILHEIGDLSNKKAWKVFYGKDLPIFNKLIKVGDIIDYHFLYPRN